MAKYIIAKTNCANLQKQIVQKKGAVNPPSYTT